MRSSGSLAGAGRVLSFALLFLASLGLVQCSEDPTAPSAGGSLGFELRFEEGLQLAGEADSLRFQIRDGDGLTLIGPLVVAYSGGSFDLDLRIPKGEDRIIQVSLESNGFRERGVLGWGEATGITVNAARTTEVTLVLAGVVPEINPIVAMPGDLSYLVSWTAPALARGYELLETRDADETVYPLKGSNFIVTLDDPKAAAAEVTYRVRSLGSFGTSVYGDPITFRPDEIRDLPRIVTVLPADQSSEVLDTLRPTLTFDRPMDWASLEAQSVQLTDVDSEVAFPILADGTSATLTLSHFDAFVRGRRFRIDVLPGLLGADGRPFDQDPETEGLQGFSSEFTVEVYNPLSVTAVAPTDGAVDVAILGSVEVDLSREFDPATATAESIVLRNDLGEPVAGALTLTATRILFVPDAPLLYDAAYSVHLSTAILDLRGEALDQDETTPIPVYEPFSSSFRTESQPIGARVVRAVPIEGDQNWPVFADIEVEFDRPMDATTVQSQGSFSVRKLPVGAGISGSVAAGNDRRVFTFHPANPLEQGTRYQIDLTVGIRDDSGVPMDQDPDLPGFQGFRTEFRAEENLRVTRITPPDRQTRIPPDAPIEIEFNLPADGDRFGPESVTLEAGGGASIEIDRSLSADGRTATLSAQEPLDLFTEYTVRINENLWTREGSRFDQDLSQAGYQPFLSRFTTRPESIPPRIVAVTPEDLATAVERRPELRVTFSKPIQPGSFNASTAMFRPVGGEEIPTTLSVSADSLRGFLLLGADLELSTQYLIEITNWVVDRFDVRLDQDPVASERQGFEATFRTDVERVPPQVTAVRPAHGSVEVPLAVTVEIDFSEAMDPGSLPLGVFLELDGQAVAGTVTATSGNLSAQFVPTVPLLENRTYQVRVTAATTDVAGNSLDPFLSDFTTESDLLGPFVLGVIPGDGEEGVSPELRPSLIFSEAVDTTTVLLAVSLEDSLGADVPLQQIEIVSMSEVRIIPVDDLETLHRYAVMVGSALRDTVGNAFDQDPDTPEDDLYLSHFTTREEQVPPQATGAFFDEQPPPQTTLIRVAFTEPIEASSLDAQDAVLKTREEGEEVGLLLSFGAPDTLHLRPVEQLRASTAYELSVTGLEDLVGNPFDQDPDTPVLDPFIKFFTTARDVRPPAVEKSSPADGETGVLADAVISLLFDEPMDPSTFSELFYRVIRIEGSQEFPAGGEITWDVEQRRFFFTPENPLLEGFFYLIRADFHLRDLAGNPLDQDRSTSIEDPFLAEFLVGEFPVADAGADFCSAETTLVTVDGSASFDPDGVIERAVWQWGDGSTDTEIFSPGPSDLIVEHGYPCLDIAGCDGIDNDGDGLMDDLDCDESYQIVLRIFDEDGLSSSDTTGVSFCGFGVLATDPVADAAAVDTLLAEVSIQFTRSIDGGSLTADHFELREVGAPDAIVPDTIRFGEDEATVVLELAGTLGAGLEYELRIDGPADSQGRLYDADPCTPELDPLTIRFTTIAAAEPRGAVR